jgi:hypothetical protein
MVLESTFRDSRFLNNNMSHLPLYLFKNQCKIEFSGKLNQREFVIRHLAPHEDDFPRVGM